MSESLVKRSLKEELLKPRYRDAFGPVVNAVLLEQGLAAQLCNSLHLHEERAQAPMRARRHEPSSSRADSSPLPEPELRGELTVVSAIHDKWTAQIHATLTHHCEETGQPLMRVTSEGGRGVRPTRGVKWLFSTDEILTLLESVHHPNHVRALGGSGRSWCLTPVELSTAKLHELREKFAELAPTERQGGLDDELRMWFAEERYAIGERLLAKGYAPMLTHFCRQGVPVGLRGKVWLAALKLGTIAERDYNYFAALQREVGRVTLATDEIVRRDAAAPSREEDYFVFGEMVEELLLAFCRDPVVAQVACARPSAPFVATQSSRRGRAPVRSLIAPVR